MVQTASWWHPPRLGLVHGLISLQNVPEPSYPALHWQLRSIMVKRSRLCSHLIWQLLRRHEDIPVNASVHTYEGWLWRNFCNGPKLHLALAHDIQTSPKAPSLFAELWYTCAYLDQDEWHQCQYLWCKCMQIGEKTGIHQDGRKYSGLRSGIQFTKPFRPTAPVRCSMCVNNLFQFKLSNDKQRTLL